jgi:hypothetical protein
MESVWRDLKYAFRILVRTPGFTVIAALCLALGIGANTSISTLTNSVLLNPFPAHLLELFTVDRAPKSILANVTGIAMSLLNYKEFRDQKNVFSGLAGYFLTGITLTGRANPRLGSRCFFRRTTSTCSA